MYMQFFLKLVILNVFRDWRKNLIACIAIVIGCSSLILFGGYIGQIYEGLRLGSIYSQLGHYQIHSEGSGDGEYSKGFIDGSLADEIRDALLPIKGVDIVSKRIEMQGLILSSEKSVGVIAYGVEADQDAEISMAVSIVEGSGLFVENMEGALIGKELLEELEASVGDVLTFLTTTASGAVNAIDVSVVGVIDTGAKEMNKRFIKMNLALMQEVLYEDSITNMVVLVDESEVSGATEEQIRGRVKEVGSGLIVKSWDELSDQYHQIVNMFNNIFTFITGLVVIIVFSAILNTMTMGVFERVSELSTTRALGFSSREVLLLIASEGFVVGMIGVLSGVSLGTAAAILVNYANIEMPKPPGSTFSYPLRILIDLKILTYAALLTLAATVVGSVLPALKAARLPISESTLR